MHVSVSQCQFALNTIIPLRCIKEKQVQNTIPDVCVLPPEQECQHVDKSYAINFIIPFTVLKQLVRCDRSRLSHLLMSYGYT